MDKKSAKGTEKKLPKPPGFMTYTWAFAAAGAFIGGAIGFVNDNYIFLPIGMFVLGIAGLFYGIFKGSGGLEE